MKHPTYLSIGEFSRLTGINKDNLRFYNRAGLLLPEGRGENGYRYYTNRQFDMAFLITALRTIGIGLPEIKRYSAQRSPERLLLLVAEQDARIEKEIKRLRILQEQMHTRAKMVTEALQMLSDRDFNLVVEDREEEPIYLCPELPDSMSDEDGVVEAYVHAEKEGVNTNAPMGAIVAEERARAGDFSKVCRYYFKTREDGNAFKPAGKYALFYGRCPREDPEPLYQKLIQLLLEKGLRIIGETYEETPLDELCIKEREPFGLRIEVRVSE